MPCTIPEAATVATVVKLLAHVPPGVASVSVAFVPGATDEAPLIAATVGEPVIVIAAVVAVVLPQLLIAVNVYTPALAVPTVSDAGLRYVEVKLLGPLHE